MMTILKKLHIRALLSAAILSTVAMVGTTSCSAIYDDLPECTSGARLRFIYDYNMEYANAFMHNVECLTVYFYDKDGRHVATRTENSKILADENYRMTVDLPAGKYRAVAYGGIGCDDASFSHPGGQPVAGNHFSELSLQMHDAHLSEAPESAMHDLFWGAVEFSVSETLGQYTEATCEMIKDTNNIRIVLQHVNGDPIDPSHFKFEIFDDNTLMAHDNKVVKNGDVTYSPWSTGTSVGGFMDNGTPITNGYAELSVARLVEENSPKLRITKVADPDSKAATTQPYTVLEIPLINYLMLYRSELYSNMDKQEFLDRESRWSLLFLLNQNDRWYKTEIKVNDWTVRVNDINFDGENY